MSALDLLIFEDYPSPNSKMTAARMNIVKNAIIALEDRVAVLESTITSVLTSGSLADLASQQTVIDIATRYVVYQVTTDFAARVRLYTDAAKQAADVARDWTVDPAGDHGVVLDVQTTGGAEFLTMDMAPAVIGFVSGLASIAVPITVSNLSGITRPITVTITAGAQ